MEYNRLGSFCHSLLLLLFPLHRRTGKWRKAWERGKKAFPGPIRTTIHGFPAFSTFNYSYPIVTRGFSSFNDPLVELANQQYLAKGSPIAVVDIGAAIGDTMFLLLRNCEGMVDRFYCFEGDAEFYKYLEANLGGLPNATLLFKLLSSEEGNVRELVRIHPGTASAQGATQVKAVTLDSVFAELSPPAIDLIKVDVDGFDGRVLMGAERTLGTFKPAVIFE